LTVREREGLDAEAGVEEEAEGDPSFHLRVKKSSTTTDVLPLGPVTWSEDVPSGNGLSLKVTEGG